MALTINTNVPSLNAQRNLSNTQGALAQSMERLSSGLRINSAKDDAAGLAISDRMTSQINGLDQASRNANDGISLAQTAEGSMQEATNILQRMRELSIQSANDSNSASDRASLQKEVSQLQQELNRIATTSEFNGKLLLDGSFTSQSFQVGANKGQTIDISIGDTRATEIGDYNISTNTIDAASSRTSLAQTLTVAGNLGSETVSVSSTDNARDVAAAVNKKTAGTGVDAEAVTFAKLDNLSTAGGITFNLQGINTTPVNVSAQVTDPSDLSGLVQSINDHAGETGITASLDDNGAVIMKNDEGYDIQLSNLTQSGGGSIDVTTLGSDGVTGGTAASVSTGGGATAQGVVDFHSASSYSVSTTSTTNGLFSTASNSASLDSVGAIDIGSRVGAGDALKVLDSAISFIDEQRASLGAYQNRFQSTISNLQNISENISSARSRIRDADIAAETSNLTKQNILQQAGVAVLSQANTTPQLALQLLQGG